MIEKQHKRKQEIQKMEEYFGEKYAKERKYDADKALFDFDESVDNLSAVSERYIAPVEVAAIQGNELNSTEEQGNAKEIEVINREVGGEQEADHERPAMSPTPMLIESHSKSRKELSKKKILRNESD